jgi:hypothetical protein
MSYVYCLILTEITAKFCSECRFFEREVNFGLKLLAAVRTDLEDVVAITSGGKNITSSNQNKPS